MADTPTVNLAEAERTALSFSHIERLRELYYHDRRTLRVANDTHWGTVMEYAFRNIRQHLEWGNAVADDTSMMGLAEAMRLSSEAIAEQTRVRELQNARAYDQAIGRERRPRSETDRGVKCHFKNRRGWTRVENRSDVSDHPDFTLSMATMVPQTARTISESLSQENMPIVREDFRLVKTAEIRDYKTNTTRKEAWFEEI